MSPFDKKQFALLLERAKGNRSINQFALHCGVSAAHISRLLRCLLDSPPSAEIIKKISDKAYNSVSYLDLMQAVGHIPRDSSLDLSKLSSLTKEESLIEYGPTCGSPSTVAVPLIKDILFQGSLLTESNILEYIYLPHAFANEATFTFKIIGTSLSEMEIYDEDLLVIAQLNNENSVKNGQTVLAKINEKIFVKRYYQLGNKIRLEPAAASSKPLMQENVEIIGIVLTLIRKLT
ncbi:MAG: S24 family peptidase [Bacillota bacterium]|nr:S24 family peptidase [Bacillota bacterium]